MHACFYYCALLGPRNSLSFLWIMLMHLLVSRWEHLLLISSERSIAPLEFSLALDWLPEFGLWCCSAEASMHQTAQSQMLSRMTAGTLRPHKSKAHSPNRARLFQYVASTSFWLVLYKARAMRVWIRLVLNVVCRSGMDVVCRSGLGENQLGLPSVG